MITVHPFYERYGLRLHEIPIGTKAPVAKGWPDSNKMAEEVQALLRDEWNNKYGWILDDWHFVVDVDVHNDAENGLVSLDKLETNLGYRLSDVCKAIVYTPSGGRHYYFTKPANVKFGKVFKDHYPGLDFIAGKGKQVIAANSSHDKHPGYYELEEEAELVEAPASLIEHLVGLRAKEKTVAVADPWQERSGDDFNKSELGLDLLVMELRCRGYAIRRVGEFYEFDRPGKSTDSDRSGYVGKKSQQGNYQLTCFSLSDDYFPPGEPMAIFHAYALLCHNGAHTEAAEALYRKGFAKQDDSDVNLAGLLVQANGQEPDDEDLEDLTSDPGPMPNVDPPGFLRDVVRHNLETAMYPQPELALGAAIALMATITGRKVACGSMRTNTYCIGVAPSGAGKEHARQLNKTLLFLAGGEKMIGPERLGSHAGLITSVVNQPAILFQLDEINRLLKTMKGSGPKAPHLYNIGGVLIQMESSANTIWIADAYADASKTKRINQPHACVYGTGVPEDFWTSISLEDMKNGLMGRVMLFESPLPYPDFSEPVVMDPPDSLIEAVKWWIQFAPGGNLSEENPTPKQVPESPEAKARMREHFRGIAARRVDETAGPAALWSRSGGRAQKLALIFACSRCIGSVSIQIEREDVERAIRLSNWMTRRILFMADEYTSSNDVEDRAKRFLRTIPSREGITRSQLTRRTQWLRRREREELLSELIEARLVKVWTDDDGRKPKQMIRRLVKQR